ncbi:Ff.00g018810.m01.CDS01 [Fusarium sp. VM40]|nr:Ff.00g018810.m01.CDS01 [Fusarium sp. VM40]
MAACLNEVRSSTGRKCDGYQSNPPSTPSTSPQSTASPSSIVSTYTTSTEARSFQFFIEKTLVNFQTFFPDDLWGTRVLQVAQSAGCIKHSLVALANYHELYLTHQQWLQLESAHALKHYNLAIRELLTPSPDDLSQGHIPILSCLIFISIELLQGKTDSAITLFKYGCRMIQQFRKSLSNARDAGERSCSDVEDTLGLVQACFRRIAVQILTLMGDIDPDLWEAFHGTFDKSSVSYEIPFTSLADAREALLELLVEQTSPGLKGKSIHEILAHSAKLEQWGCSYDALLAEYDRVGRISSAAEKRAIALLQLHRKYLEINVSKYVYGQGDPCFWDRFTAEFDEIVNYAATAAGLDENYAHRNWSTDSTSTAYFHLDLGFSSVLVAVIARCRDPFIRRRAIAVMLTNRVQEGAFNGSQSARVAAKVMELEEARSGDVRCSSDIPEEARVRTIRVQLLGSETPQTRVVFGFDGGFCEEKFSLT